MHLFSKPYIYIYTYIYIFVLKKSEVDKYLKEKKKIMSPSHDAKENTLKKEPLYWIPGHLYSDLNWYHKIRKKRRKINK